MKLALCFLFWTFMTKIDELLHFLFDWTTRYDWCPVWIFNFCQWSWSGWCDTLDAIEEKYKPKGENRMSVITTADEKRELFNNQLDELSNLIDEIQNTTQEMFDKETWGAEYWAKTFKYATNRLSDHLLFIKNDIRDYDLEWNQ
jgi:hypothetical protein